MTTLREPVQGLSGRRSDRAAALAGVTTDRFGASTLAAAKLAARGGVLDDTSVKVSSIFAEATAGLAGSGPRGLDFGPGVRASILDGFLKPDRVAALAGVTADRYTSTIGQARTALLGGIVDDTSVKVSSIFADAANAVQGLSGLRADRAAALAGVTTDRFGASTLAAAKLAARGGVLDDTSVKVSSIFAEATAGLAGSGPRGLDFGPGVRASILDGFLKPDRVAALAGVTADRYTSTIGQARTALLGGILDDTVVKTSSIFADAANAVQGLSGLRADRAAALAGVVQPVGWGYDPALLPHDDESPPGWVERQSGLLVPRTPEAAMVMLGSTVVALLALYWWIVDRERAELVMQALATGEIGRQLYRAALRSRGRN